MAQADLIAFNIAAFIAALFILESGADKFIDHTAILARRTRLSETHIGLLTVGGEWEELAVVVASLLQGRSSLAVGNVIGAAISNILGAFSLGLLALGREADTQFDRSARIYSIVLLILTTLVTPVLYYPARLVWQICGPVLIATFGAYLLLVGIAIKRGVVTAPEDSDSDFDSDFDSDNDQDIISDAGSIDGIASATETDALISPPDRPHAEGVSQARGPGVSPHPALLRRRRQHTLKYHGFYLLFGLFAICLAGYILSQAAINITDQFGVSDVLFGMVFLAVATTLPEKFVAVVSGYRSHPGILVANCVGSNIFLLALCLGIVMANSRGDLDRGTLTMPELATLWASTLGLTLTVWFGARFSRWIGAAMLVGYVVFIVFEVMDSSRVVG